MFRKIIFCILISCIVSAKGIYLGVGGGLSHLEPDDNQDPAFALDEEYDFGYKVFLGYQINDSWSIEAFHTDMGKSDFSPAGHVDYKMTGIGGNYHYPLNDTWKLFTGLGYGNIDNEGTDLTYTRVNDDQVYFKLGLDYMLKKTYRIRSEIEYYDKDAQFLGFSIIKDFHIKPKSKKVAPIIVALPIKPKIKIKPKPTPKLVIKETKKPCFISKYVYFEFGKYILNQEQKDYLSNLAKNDFRNEEVMVVGYTDSIGDNEYNYNLGTKRAKNVKFYLSQNGVKIININSLGESKPVATNIYKHGRKQNRRVAMSIKAINNDGDCISENSTKNYIQIDAFTQRPSQKYMNELSKYEDYLLYKIKINNKMYTKVLIGPFENTEVQKELQKIKQNVNKNAFIYKM